MRAATGSQCWETKRGVTWALLGSLKTNHAAAFWIICKGLIVHDGSPARRALQSRNDKGLDKKLCNVLCKEAPDLSDVVQCKPAGLSSFWNVVFESEPKIRISKITPRFLTELDGVIVDESIWMVKSCCRVGVAGKTRSSVFPRLSCRWCSFSHAEMSARQPEIRADTVGSSGQNER